uniref:Uncharacterized protein n=1 Tax=Norrisiella sphaerica TaxID=552664 RepID=A0A7S2QTA5_9EUKA|mmetsp:Transcript_463/g.688  ORF Transcript_463/g.688 Transcript_463/m.688 type:complete len:207 (+) Transcript_463:212-832(+)|eukprot:CAMPEP_0184479852 /NCGR_PEP_ID=MMETSP0113_2-20130426/1411_1 /TAXON_ID=91329 /ORGANISM="Norrisiella sphaerica, Strain BC52" /LENGTH=206 /DNA_ID=CAMNT_0026858013 /DNA_START=190 /DNA_END=810 /DNA_ORIENTATION=-
MTSSVRPRVRMAHDFTSFSKVSAKVFAAMLIITTVLTAGGVYRRETMLSSPQSSNPANMIQPYGSDPASDLTKATVGYLEGTYNKLIHIYGTAFKGSVGLSPSLATDEKEESLTIPKSKSADIVLGMKEKAHTTKDTISRTFDRAYRNLNDASRETNARFEGLLKAVFGTGMSDEQKVREPVMSTPRLREKKKRFAFAQNCYKPRI